MKTLSKIIFIVAILSISFIVKNDPLKLFKNNPLNIVNGKVYTDEELGTSVYFKDKKASLIIKGDNIGWVEYERKWKNGAYLYNSEQDRDFYFVFILKGNTVSFTTMHRFEILEIERGSDNPFANPKVNKSRNEFITLKLVNDIESWDKIVYASNGNSVKEKADNRGIENWAGRWIDEDYITWFIINTDGSVILKSYDETQYRVKDITKSSDTSYSFMTKEDYIFNLFFEDNDKCLMTTVIDGNKFSIWLDKEK